MAIIRKLGGNLYELQFSAKPTVEATETADNLFEKGLDSWEAGRPDEALDFYRQALILNPDMAGALINIGRIEFVRGNETSAEEYFRKALGIDPNYSLALKNLGDCFGNRYPPQSAEAVECYLKALELRPDFADARYNLAWEYARMGERRKAISHYQAYLRCAGDDSEYWRGEAKRDIKRLLAQDLQVVPKGAVSEQSEPVFSDLQVG